MCRFENLNKFYEEGIKMNLFKLVRLKIFNDKKDFKSGYKEEREIYFKEVVIR